jgi:hypothetical protein
VAVNSAIESSTGPWTSVAIAVPVLVVCCCLILMAILLVVKLRRGRQHKADDAKELELGANISNEPEPPETQYRSLSPRESSKDGQQQNQYQSASAALRTSARKSGIGYLSNEIVLQQSMNGNTGMKR